MDILVTFIGGLAIGFLVAMIVLTYRAAGDLRIDRSDPEEEYLFLELKENIECLSDRSYVILRVKNENYLSQK